MLDGNGWDEKGIGCIPCCIPLCCAKGGETLGVCPLLAAGGGAATARIERGSSKGLPLVTRLRETGPSPGAGEGAIAYVPGWNCALMADVLFKSPNASENNFFIISSMKATSLWSPSAWIPRMVKGMIPLNLSFFPERMRLSTFARLLTAT